MRISLWFIVAPFVYAETPKLAPAQETKRIMAQIYSDLQFVFPLSLQDKEFSKDEHRQKITESLLNLKTHVLGLKTHMNSEPVSAFVAESLSQDAEDAYRWFTKNSYAETSFVLHHMIENCIACHSRSPAVQSFVNSKDFSKAIQSGQLSPTERIKLLVATRQFDDAISQLENFFLDEKTDLNQVFADGTIIDYLKLCIQVQNNFERPESFIFKLESKRTLSNFVTKLLSRWKEDLAKLAKDRKKNMSLEEMRDVFAQENKKALFYSASLGFVRYISLATDLRQKMLENPQPVVMAEIQYLLGYIENLIDHSFWLSESKFYLEAAIHTAPHSEPSEKAYNFLEEQTILGFTGSAGVNLPEEVSQWLSGLRAKALPQKPGIGRIE